MNSELDGIALYVMCLTSSLTPIYSPIFQDLDLSTVHAGEFSHTNSPRVYTVVHLLIALKLKDRCELLQTKFLTSVSSSSFVFHLSGSQHYCHIIFSIKTFSLCYPLI